MAFVTLATETPVVYVLMGVTVDTALAEFGGLLAGFFVA